MTFSKQYTDNNFRRVLSTDIPMTIATLVRAVGCSRNTAKDWIKANVSSGKIKREQIDNERYGYILVN
jgi:DNA-binding Lrp family transcriptional regulator